MCLAHVPLFKPEDFVIVKALGNGDFQWYSSTFAGGRLDNNWDSFEVLERTTWIKALDLYDGRASIWVHAVGLRPYCEQQSAESYDELGSTICSPFQFD
jgi:hypothetical protein